MDINNIIRDLDQLDDQVEKAKNEFSSNDGQIKQLYNSVENEFGIKTLEEIDSLIEEKGKKKEQIDSQIETEYAELKENFEW